MERFERFRAAYEHLRSCGLVHNNKDLAKMLDMDAADMSKCMNGKSNRPSVGTMKRLCDAYKGVFNIEWLVNGTGEMLQGGANIVNNGNNSIVGYSNSGCSVVVGSGKESASETTILPNQYGDSPDIERKWAPVVPRAMASMPDFDIIDHIKKQMTGGNVERLYSGTLDIDIWHYIETRNLEPKFEKGDCLGLKSFEVGHEFIREGDIHVVDTKSKGLVTTLLFSDGNGGYYGMATFPKEHKDVVIPKEDVIRIYRKVIMFRY